MSPVSKNRGKKRGSKRPNHEWTDPEPGPLPPWFAPSIEAILRHTDSLVRTTGPRELEQATCARLGEQLYPAVREEREGVRLDWWFAELTAATAARVRESADLTGDWWLLHGLAAIGPPALRSFARQQINNLLPAVRRRPGAHPRWLATTHLVKATGEVWRMQDTYGTRIAVLARMSYRHGTDPSVFLFDIDACGFPELAGAGSYDDLDQAAAAWRAGVGDTADGTEPVEVRTGEELSCLDYCDIGTERVSGDETRDRLDNWFRAQRCLHDLALALRKTPLLWPERESVFDDLDLDPMATEFSLWYAEQHGEEPDPEIVEALTEEWLEGALPETRYLISPHRVAHRRALIVDCWPSDQPSTVTVLSLLVEWTRWLGRRAGLSAELIDRAVEAPDLPTDMTADGRQTPQDLAAEFASWAGAHGLDVDPFVIGTTADLLDAVPWTTRDLREVMVELFPRKVTMSESERPGVIPALHGWIDFLTERYPRPPGDVADLHAEIDRNTAAFLAAMADEREFGVAKFWATKMIEHGVDAADEAQVQRFLTMTQTGEIDYDQDVLAEIMSRETFGTGPFEFEADLDRLLPPVSLPTPEELATLAASAPLVTRLQALLSWVGTGRTLTSAERLRVVDAKDLAGLLDVDHPQLARARGSEDLPETSLLVEWAKAAKLVRTVKGRLVPIKSAAGLLDRPFELWRQAIDAFPGLGAALCGPGGYPSLLGHHLPDVAPALWLSLYTAGGSPVPVDLLFEITQDALAEPDVFDVGDLIDDADEVLWRRDLTAVLAAMELAGAVELSGDSFVGLTPLGLCGVRDLLRAEGFDAPLTDDLAHGPAGTMCDALEYATPEVTEAMLTAWVEARDEDAAAAELAALCVSAPTSWARLVAMNGLAHTGPAGVAQAQRLRAAGGLAGAVATTWLIEHAVLDERDASQAELTLSLADNFAALHEHDMMIEDLETYPIDDQVGLVHALAGSDHPDRARLLEVIATDHPDRTVADAARKAAGGRRNLRAIRER